MKEGCANAFVSEFHQRFADHFLVIPTLAADERRLFGTPLTEESKRRVGDFVGISIDKSILLTAKDTEKVKPSKSCNCTSWDIMEVLFQMKC